MSGTLYICATPIGNREDMTYRAVKTLQEVDLIAAEDTRHSRGLLEYYGIDKPLTSYHEHNKYEKAEELVGRLLQGENIALVTDAGTPVISDPGEVLVKACYEAGVPVTSLPGPCALITALTLSGISGRRFVFEGFLPMENKDRRRVLESLRDEERTMILYEAPHRLRRTLEELQEVLGCRRLRICRELTKVHEEAAAFTLPEAVEWYREQEPRGEYVLVLEGRSPEEKAAETRAAVQELTLQEHMALYTEQGMDRKAAMKKVAEERGLRKQDVYRLLLEEKE